MKTARLYHNPRCSKSRAALALLEEPGVDFEVVSYLQNPPDESELHTLLGKLGTAPIELMRRLESKFRELGLGGPGVADHERVRAMSENPILIERPIFCAGGKAIAGRPPERVLELL